MRSTEQLGWPAWVMHSSPSPDGQTDPAISADPPPHCAYNQTRECFLGLEVAAGEFSYEQLGEILATQALKSGEGLWLRPLHGITSRGLYAPLDLIYLDDDCCVIETVESSLTFPDGRSTPRAASLLVLPAHSIYSSQTQVGDQLVLCIAEEMQSRLESLAGGTEDTSVVQSAVLLREEPLWSGGPGLVELEDRSEKQNPGQPQPHEMTLIEPGIRAVNPPKNWQERWWSPDPRIAPREHAPGLAAYYWNGVAPKAHSVRDISASGLYVITEERWYPGTLVLMTLKRTEAGDEIAERSISVLSRAVRWGDDGVGLQFVLNDEPDPRRAKSARSEGANKKELGRFLDQLLKAEK